MSPEQLASASPEVRGAVARGCDGTWSGKHLDCGLGCAVWKARYYSKTTTVQAAAGLWPQCHRSDCEVHTSGRKDNKPTCFAHGGRKR